MEANGGKETEQAMEGIQEEEEDTEHWERDDEGGYTTPVPVTP